MSKRKVSLICFGLGAFGAVFGAIFLGVYPYIYAAILRWVSI